MKDTEKAEEVLAGRADIVLGSDPPKPKTFTQTWRDPKTGKLRKQGEEELTNASDS